MDLQNRTQNQKEVPVIRNCSATLGCSFIDENGNEQPITEELIQQACAELEKRLVTPAKQD